MNKYSFIFTFLLFVFLIYSRFISRNANEFSVDERFQVENLTTVHHIIYEYLPFTPGIAPGHYLMTLPLNILFPGNKIALSLPGLFASILVFFLIPKAIEIMTIKNKEKNYFAVGFARFCFVLDPVLNYQSIEIRPYSILPFMWILILLLMYRMILIANEKSSKSAYFGKVIFHSFLLLALFSLHFYGFLMSLSIYTYFMFHKRTQIKKFIYSFLTLSMLLAIGMVIPIWKHFTIGTSQFRFKTFEYFSLNFIDIFQKYLKLSPVLIWPLFILLGIFIIMSIQYFDKNYFSYSRNINKLKKRIFSQILQILLPLVILPVVMIFIIDLIHPYWFLYRQFAWVALPLYIYMGIFISNMRIFNKYFLTYNEKKI